MSHGVITFYTTTGCHLCEQAAAILQRAPLSTAIPMEVVDIATSPVLVERYGTRIPVLHRSDNGNELGWPFGEREVLAFLESPLR